MKIDTTLVSVSFPGLVLEYYDESILLTLASVVGTPRNVDMRTLDIGRGRFASVCVKIDLDKPMIERF